MNQLQSHPDASSAAARRSYVMRNLILVTIKILISAGVLFYLVGKIGIEAIIQKVLDIELEFLIAAITLETLSVFLAALRWKIALQAFDLRVGFNFALKNVYIGNFVNQVLPSNLGGDAVRAWRLHRIGSTLSYAVGGVVADRVAALVGLALVVTATLPLAHHVISDATAFITLTLVAASVFAGFGAVLVIDRIAKAIPLLPDAVRREAYKLNLASRRLFLTRGYSLSTLGLSVLIHLLTSSMVWVLAIGLGISVPPASYFVLVPPIILVSVVPVSLAGWGLREASMVIAFSFVALPSDAALTLSLFFGLVVLVSALPGLGFLFTAKLGTGQNPPSIKP